MRCFGHFVLILSLPFLGCSLGDRLRQVYWSSSHHQPLSAELATLISHPKKNNFQSSRVGEKRVEHWRMVAGDFPVANSWVKVVRNLKGAPESIRGQVLQLQPLSDDIKRAQQLERRKQYVLQVAWEKYPELREAKKVFPVQVVLERKMVGYEPFLEVAYFNRDETEVVRLKLSGTANIIERHRLSHHFTKGNGRVFLGAPNRTQLSEVEFLGLVGNGTLTSPVLRVESAVSNRAYSPSHEFLFRPEEQPFDEVQAYYFVERVLAWLKKDYGFILPFQLNIKVHVGGLRPSNAAFYYRGNIRLGDGDGIIYKNIPKDPTIVIHEVAHGVVEVIAGLPTEEEGGALNEGFSDFLAAVFLNNPRMAEYAYLKAPYRRNLENNLQAHRDFNGGLYHDSTIVSGTLWDVKKALGSHLSGKLALGVLGHLGPGSKLADFPEALMAAAGDSQLDDKQIGILQSVLNQRGWL